MQFSITYKKQTYDSARLLALLMIWPRDVFSTSAMGALAPAILKIGLLAPAILKQ